MSIDGERAAETAEGLLQWRKLSGDTQRAHRRSSATYSPTPCSAKISKRQVKVSRQDVIREDAKIRRMRLDNATKKPRACPKDKKLHVVPTKKAQFSHLTTQRDEDKGPIVYDSSSRKEHAREEATALWLQPFTVVDDY